MNKIVESFELYGKQYRFETGELAKQASGAVLVTQGETTILVTAVISKEQKDHYRKLMDADAATTRELINSLPKSAHQVNIQDVLNGAAGAGNATDLSKMSWDDIDKAERLGELKDKFPELYKAKFKEKFGVSL